MCGSSNGSSTSGPPSLRPLDPAVISRLVDAHCHPADDDDFESAVEALTNSRLSKVCAMSSSRENQDITTRLHESNPDKVIPCYGVHPWFIHSLSLVDSPTPPSKEVHYATLFPSASDVSQPHPALAELLPTLPTPLLLSDFLATLSNNLSSHSTSLLGEVGLDKAFRLPNPPSLASSSKNSELQTPLAHQIAVVEAQVEVAIELLRHVSFHSVRAPQDTVQLLERLSWKEGFGRIHICLHSFGGSPDTAVQIQKAHRNVFFSFATIISARSPRFHDLLRAIEPDRLLVESDFSHTSQLDNQIWEVFETIREARGWSEDECVERLEANWERFMQVEPEGTGARRKSKKERKLEKGRQVAGGVDGLEDSVGD